MMAFALSTGIYGNITLDAPLSILNYYFASLSGNTLATMAMGFRHKIG
jgi:hypothetical protein